MIAKFEEDTSTLQPTRLAFTQSVREQLWQCSWGVAWFSSSWWLVAGPVTSSCIAFGNKSRNSTTTSPKKLLTHMFHRHIPIYTSPLISNLDPRQHNHPNNAKTRINLGGDMAWQARLPAFAQFHWASWSIILQQTPPSHRDPWKYKNGGSISFGANGVGQRGLQIIIWTWFQSPTALVYLLGLYT